MKHGIAIGIEIPKLVPLKSAAIKREYIHDFTPQELEQFKQDAQIECKIKKVYPQIDIK